MSWAYTYVLLIDCIAVLDLDTPPAKQDTAASTVNNGKGGICVICAI